MIGYKNFSLENVFLINGYSETDTPEGRVRQYADEDGLEQALRRVVATQKRSLSGWDVRFLRQGMGLSQAQLGALLERDAQTIARWEKSKDSVPVLADMAVRVRFCSMYEPSFSAKDLSALIEGTAPYPDAIFLSFSHGNWSVINEPRVYVSSMVSADIETEFIVSGFGGYATSRATKKNLMITQGETLFLLSDVNHIDASLLGVHELQRGGVTVVANEPAIPAGKSAFSFNVSGLTGSA